MHVRRYLTFGSVIALLATVLIVPGAQAAQAKGDYIVVLKDSVSRPAAVARKHAKKHDAKVQHVYKNTIVGYSATLKKKELKALREDPNVVSITRDGIARIAKPGGGKKPPKDDPPPDGGDPTCEGTVSSWGQDRVDQRSLPLDSCFKPSGDGTGVTAFILDTGINKDHVQFDGRASYGPDLVDGGNTSGDCHGHGTHVAATIGGNSYGVATDVSIVGVRVLDCSGSGNWSDIIAAIDWVAGSESGTGMKVANLSISGLSYPLVDEAVADAVATGVVVVVAAGNNNWNACSFSPASAAAAITVGATMDSDRRARYSNYGSCLDIFAPGDRIESVGGTKSGTSMAAPHVAGAAALYFERHPAASSADVAAGLDAASSKGKVGRRGSGSPNKLLYVD